MSLATVTMRVRPTNWPLLVSLWAEYALEDGHLDPDLRDDVPDDGTRYALTFDRETLAPVGFTAWAACLPCHTGCAAVEVRHLYVRDGSRGYGVGKGMVYDLLVEASMHGACSVVHRARTDDAATFCEGQLGWNQIDRRTWQIPALVPPEAQPTMTWSLSEDVAPGHDRLLINGIPAHLYVE